MQPLQKNAQAQEEPEALLRQLQGAKTADERQAALIKLASQAASSEKAAKYFAENYGKIAPLIKKVLEAPLDEKHAGFLGNYFENITIVEQMFAIGKMANSKEISADIVGLLLERGEENHHLAQTVLNGIYQVMEKGGGADYIARNYGLFRETFLSAPQLLFEFGKRTDHAEAVRDLRLIQIDKEQIEGYWKQAVMDFEVEKSGPNMRRQMLGILARIYRKVEKNSDIAQTVMEKLGQYADEKYSKPEVFAEYPELASAFVGNALHA
ncbi:MAG: hypothetical protein QW568_05285, partial [Candidatus Anstonellaceae archaeon]